MSNTNGNTAHYRKPLNAGCACGDPSCSAYPEQPASVRKEAGASLIKELLGALGKAKEGTGTLSETLLSMARKVRRLEEEKTQLETALHNDYNARLFAMAERGEKDKYLEDAKLAQDARLTEREAIAEMIENLSTPGRLGMLGDVRESKRILGKLAELVRFGNIDANELHPVLKERQACARLVDEMETQIRKSVPPEVMAMVDQNEGMSPLKMVADMIRARSRQQ